MTGSEVRLLREGLGMAVPQFAQLLGIHVATAYRWELAAETALRLDPLHESLLLHLRRTVDARRRQVDREAWGKQLAAGVLIGGTLAGLALLLSELSGAPRRSRPRARRR